MSRTTGVASRHVRSRWWQGTNQPVRAGSSCQFLTIHVIYQLYLYYCYIKYNLYCVWTTYWSYSDPVEMDPLSITGSAIAIATIPTSAFTAFAELRTLCKSLPGHLHSLNNEVVDLEAVALQDFSVAARFKRTLGGRWIVFSVILGRILWHCHRYSEKDKSYLACRTQTWKDSVGLEIVFLARHRFLLGGAGGLSRKNGPNSAYLRLNLIKLYRKIGRKVNYWGLLVPSGKGSSDRARGSIELGSFIYLYTDQYQYISKIAPNWKALLIDLPKGD